MKKVITILSFAIAGCTASHDESLFSADSRQLTAGEEYQLALSRYEAGRILYDNNCASCHGALPTSDKRNRSAGQIWSAIGSVSSMSFLSFMSSSDNDSVAYVLNNDPPVPPVDSPAPIEIPSGGKSKVVMSNRHNMVRTLSSLFVAEGNTDSADENILDNLSDYVDTQHESFGGNESLHETTNIRTNNYSSDSNLLNASLTPGVSIMRSGYVQRFCDDTLNIDKSVRTLLSKAGLTVSSPVNLQNVDAVFDLFVPGRQASSALLQSLVDVGSAARSNGQSETDAWRFVALPLCMSGVVEVL